MVIFPLAPDQTIAQMWSNGAWGGSAQPEDESNTKKSKHSIWNQQHEANCVRLNLWAAQMIVQLQNATQHYYWTAILAIIPSYSRANHSSDVIKWSMTGHEWL